MDMDTTLSNSFFYFFSAVPQVLAAILALFGVFLIFKIQALKEELIVKATDILEYVRSSIQNDKDDNEQLSKHRHLIFNSLANWLKYKNISTFHHIICKFGSDLSLNDNMFATYSDQFIRIYNLHKGLIQATKIFSIVTIITIIGCLLVIPSGEYFLNNPDKLKSLFFITILCVTLCFVGLIIILHFALSNKSELP